MLPTKTIVGIAVTIVATGVDLFITHRMKKRAYNEGYAAGHMDGMNEMIKISGKHSNEIIDAPVIEVKEVESH